MLAADRQHANESRSRPEYIALVGSFILVGLESLIRVLTLALRTIVQGVPSFRPALVLTSVTSHINHKSLLPSVSTTIQQIHITGTEKSGAEKEV
jgi:hypothetical protein